MICSSGNKFKWRGSFDNDCYNFKDNDSLSKTTNNTFYVKVITCVNNFGDIITMTVKLGFSAANWPPKPNRVQNAKRYRGNTCLGDNRHGSFRHHKDALNPPLVVARRILDRWFEILWIMIGWLETSVLVRKKMNRRMMKETSSQYHIILTLPFGYSWREIKPSAISFASLESPIFI